MKNPILARAGTSGASPTTTARPSATQPGSWAARHDPRWPSIAEALAALRERGRFSVRIIDADCAAGSLLLYATQYAHALGFTAIEGRGIDGSPAMIGRAKAAAHRLHDPAIGLVFEMTDVVVALREEYDLPADIVICHGRGHPDVAEALSRAADRVIYDDTPGLAGVTPAGSIAA